MKPLSLKEIVVAVKGKLLQGDPCMTVTGVSCDSRVINNGDLFIAFPGKRVDGHNFIRGAFQKGSVCAVVSKHVEARPEQALIYVKDTFQALQDLARYHRSLFSIPLIGVTGSTGKTTTKSLIARVLSVCYHVLENRGNQNNEIGLPLTLLRLDSQHEVMVLEMAMRGRGEIAELASISRPTVGVLTNIGKTHLERLGNQIEIAEAKGELLGALPETGCAILNGDDPWQRFLAARVTGNKVFYGESVDLAIHASNVRLHGLAGLEFTLETPSGRAECFLSLPGRHNLLNALAAAAVGHWFGLSPALISKGLENASVIEGRLEVQKGINNSKIINDTYNASPDSVKAALLLLADAAPKRKIAVLGDMYELGSAEFEGHREVGEKAAEVGVDFLVTVGELSSGIAQGALNRGLSPKLIKSFDLKEEAADFLRKFLQKDDLVLVKGSRALQMEELVIALNEGE